MAGIHASWAMRAAKPDPHAFHRAAAFHRVRAADLIHVGDSWTEDVVPVLALGGRAVWLNHSCGPVPGSEPVPTGRLIVASTLSGGRYPGGWTATGLLLARIAAGELAASRIGGSPLARSRGAEAMGTMVHTTRGTGPGAGLGEGRGPLRPDGGRRLAAVTMSAVVIMAVGCDSTDRAGGGDSSVSSSVSAETPRARSLSELDACALLDTEQVVDYGYTDRQPFAAGTTRSCVYSDAGGADTLTISLSGVGVSDLRPDAADTAVVERVGEHEAVRIVSGSAPMCTVVMGVGGRESVSVQAKRASLEVACVQADDAAERVEPVLP